MAMASASCASSDMPSAIAAAPPPEDGALLPPSVCPAPENATYDDFFCCSAPPRNGAPPPKPLPLSRRSAGGFAGSTQFDARPAPELCRRLRRVS
eukprot:2907903-Prymnesium_polylepis.1